MQTFWNLVCRFPISRYAFIVLVALAWSSLAFGGEIHEAAKYGELEKVNALLKTNPDLVLSNDVDGHTPLYLALKLGNKAVVEVLLANKAKFNANEIMGEASSLLVTAAYSGCEGVAKLLLTNGASVNFKIYGKTPLHFATDAGQRGMMKLLLTNGADINAKDGYGWTPLHYAVASGRADVVELLLSNKAEVNAQDNIGMTPLNWAANKGYGDVAELLLANKAGVNSNNKCTPLHEALAMHHKEVAELLRQHGGHE